MQGEKVQHGAQSDEELNETVDLCVVRFFSGRLAQVISEIPQELKLLTEEELQERMQASANEWKLRQTFSDLVKEARALGIDHIPTTRIYEGVITRQTFHEAVLPNQLKIAWISRPIIEHTDYYNAIHKLALDKLFRMVKNMPEETKYLPQLLKIAETAGNRVHGPVVQRMQIHSKNLNMEMEVKELPTPEDEEDLAKKIAAMQAKLIEAPKDVTPKEN